MRKVVDYWHSRDRYYSIGNGRIFSEHTGDTRPLRRKLLARLHGPESVHVVVCYDRDLRDIECRNGVAHVSQNFKREEVRVHDDVGLKLKIASTNESMKLSSSMVWRKPRIQQ